MYRGAFRPIVMLSEAASQGVTAMRAARVVWACACTPLQQARLADALRGAARICALDRSADVVARMRGGSEAPDVVVLAVSADATRDAVDLVREIIASRPRAALVAYCDGVRDTPPSLGALAAAGVHQFLFAGINDRGVALRAIVESARQQCAAEAVMAVLRPHLPSPVHPMAEAALARPAVVTDVRALADALGVHRKTLFNRCVHAGFLGPAELLSWTRLALVGFLLESTGCTVESLAIDLGFASPTALRNAMKRYTGARPTEVRARGGLELVVGRLRARLATGTSPAPLHLV